MKSLAVVGVGLAATMFWGCAGGGNPAAPTATGTGAAGTTASSSGSTSDSGSTTTGASSGGTGTSGSSASPGGSTPTLAASSIVPSSGTTSGGTTVTITGTGFVSGTTVTIGGVALTSVTVNGAGTQVSGSTGAHSAGAVDVVVTNPGGAHVTLSGSYTYTGSGVVALSVSSISPTSGTISGGTFVTISGAGIASGAAVTVGGTALTSVSVNGGGTQVSGYTGAHGAGVVDVVVTNPGSSGATLHSAFTYVGASISVTSISPAVGSISGSNAVTITGSGFVSGATVTVGGLALTSVSVNGGGTQISGTTGARSAGVVDVVVTNPGGASSTLAGGFTYAILINGNWTGSTGQSQSFSMTITNHVITALSVSYTLSGTGCTTNATLTFSSLNVAIANPSFLSFHGTSGGTDVNVTAPISANPFGAVASGTVVVTSSSGCVGLLNTWLQAGGGGS